MSFFQARQIPFLNATASPSSATSPLTTNILTIASVRTTPTALTSGHLSPINVSSHSLSRDVMDVVVTKIISLLVLTILSVLSGLLPLRLLVHTPYLFTRSRHSVDYFLCGLRLFSGGVYMATCFLHLMPDTRDKMEAVMLNMGSHTTYAVPELLVMTGFYAVVFVEQIIQVLYVKAQNSDDRRRQKKLSRARARAEREAERGSRVFRSTLDEDIGSSNHNNNNGPKTFSGDEEDDDYDDNVLIDDEDDLSLNDMELDRRSYDSATEVKESLLEQANHRPSCHWSSSHIHSLPNHQSAPVKTVQSLTPSLNFSKPFSYTEVGTAVLRTFTGASLDALNKTSANRARNGQTTGRSVGHPTKDLTQIQVVPRSNIYHQQYRSQENISQHGLRSDHKPDQRASSSPPPVLPRAPYSLEQQQLQQLCQSFQQPSPPRTRHQYPVITDSPQGEPDPQSWTSRGGQVVGSVEHSNKLNGDKTSNTGPDNKTTADSSSKTSADKTTTDTGRDCDSGVSFTRGDGDHSESEPRKLGCPRETTFDLLSESSSTLHDIPVKRVVDELTRTDEDKTAHFRSIIYILALSFHGIFEGMALGLQSMKSSVWSLCFAIVVHRCVLAFKLGMDLCRGEERQGTTFLCIGTFTLISTLGIIIGILISSGALLYSDVTVPEAILQSLATGTIFYIVFFDILFKDMEGRDDLKRVSCSFVGFSLMAVVFAITRS